MRIKNLLAGFFGGFAALTLVVVMLGANAPGARLARGFIMRGNSSNVMAAYDANGSGQILVGDGTDLVSVAVSGDVALSSAGAVTLTANNIVSADVNADFLQVSNTQLTNTNMLALEATPITLIAAVATTAIVVHKVALFLDWTADYTESADNLVIEYADGTDIVVIEATGFVDAGADAARVITPPNGASVVVAAGGTACDTTCDGTCISGFDLAAGAEVPLACDGAGADTCLCYRPTVPVSNSLVRITTIGSGEYGGGNAANTVSVRIWYSEVPMAAFSSGG